MRLPSELGFGRLFDSVRDAVIVAEAPSGQIVQWNPAATAMFGYEADEAAALTVDVLVPPPLRAAHRAGLERYAMSGQGPYVDAATPLELPALRRDGAELCVDLTLSPLRDVADGRRYVLAIIRDVTERKRLETERTALLASEREVNRRLGELAVLKADFTAMVAHELGAPVAAIQALADLLGTGEAPPEVRDQALAAIRTETGVLAKLSADIGAAAQAERDDFAVALRPIPVAVLLADGSAIARTLPGEHPFVAEAKPDSAHTLVWADPDRIGQVLRNLLGNAAKYSEPGTEIKLAALRSGERVRLQVADRGAGIHPYDLTRIFEKFGRGRDREGGSVPGIGLGLYLSRRIVQAHGSDLTVESLPGVGSVFGFELEVAA